MGTACWRCWTRTRRCRSPPANYSSPTPGPHLTHPLTPCQCQASGLRSPLGPGWSSPSSGLRMSRKYDHLVSLHHLDKDEIVEVKPSVIESQLPPSIKQKKFGSS